MVTLIRGGILIDGSGREPVRSDVLIDGGIIAQVGTDLDAHGGLIRDATDLVLAPGLIDFHSHADFTLPAFGAATNSLMQGVTTKVVGNCGWSPAPLGHVGRHRSDWMEMCRGLGPDLSWDWTSFEEFLGALELARPAVNCAPLVGHGAIRMAIVGPDDRPATDPELAAMGALLGNAIEDGAWGMSSGPVYPPGSFASTKELIVLASEVHRHRALYAVHLRDEGDRLGPSLSEILTVAEVTGVNLENSHLKAIGAFNRNHDDKRPTDVPRKGITPRQAEARRENGKKSRGPVTEEGKRQSSSNSLKHAIWAKPLQAIVRGPLAEDGDEMTAFVGSVLEELDPGESFLLRQAALDIADKMWRLTRAQRWEAEGYMAPETAPPLTDVMEQVVSRAKRDRRGAEALRGFPDPSITKDDLWNALGPLSIHVGAAEDKDEDENLMDADDVAAALMALVDEHFDSREEAAAWLDSSAERRESEATIYYELNAPRVIRDEVDSAFPRNAERLVSHASRELDRGLKRYWEMKERAQLTQSTVAAASQDWDGTEDTESSVDDSSSEAPVDDSNSEAPVDDSSSEAPVNDSMSTRKLNESDDEPLAWARPSAPSDLEGLETAKLFRPGGT